MSRPPFLTAILGHTLVAFGVAVAFVVVLCQFLFAGGSGWLTLGLLVAVTYVSKCYNHVQAYRMWKLEWDSMSGQPAKPPLIRRGSMLEAAVAGSLFAMASFALMSNSAPEHRAMFGTVFVLGTLGFIVLVVRRFLRETPLTRPARRTKYIIATVCLRVPKASPHAAHSYGQLPEYCQYLMRRQ